MKRLIGISMTLGLTLGLAQGCTNVVYEDGCNNPSSVQVEEGCPSSRDHFPRRRQGPGTW